MNVILIYVNRVYNCVETSRSNYYCRGVCICNYDNTKVLIAWLFQSVLSHRGSLTTSTAEAAINLLTFLTQVCHPGLEIKGLKFPLRLREAISLLNPYNDKQLIENVRRDGHFPQRVRLIMSANAYDNRTSTEVSHRGTILLWRRPAWLDVTRCSGYE